MSMWAIPSAIAVVVLTFLTFYVVARRPLKPLWPALLMVLVASLIFAIGDVLTFVVVDADTAWVPVTILYTGIMFVPPTWWVLAHRFAEASNQPFPWGNRRWIYAPFALTALLWLGMITNPWHGQFLTQVLGARNVYHWMWWIYATTGYALIFGTIILYLILAMRVTTRSHQIRIYVMLSASVVNIAGNLLYIIPTNPVSFDPTAAGFGVSGVLLLLGIYRTGLFSLSRVAVTDILHRQPNGILVADANGGLLYWNPAAESVLRTSLYTVRNIYTWLGERLSTVDEQENTIGESTLERYLESLESTPKSRLFRFPADGEYWLRISAATIHTSRGQAVARCIQVDDYTLRHEEEVEKMGLQKQLAESQRLDSLGVLAGGVAHDFNNLLMSIRGNAELARSSKFGEQPPQRHLETIVEACNRGARLTQHLLAYAGNSPMKTHPLNLSVVVRDTLEFLESTNLLRGFNLELNLHDEVWIDGDKIQIEQVLMNLAINAAESSGLESGRLFISTGVSKMNAADLALCIHGADNLPERSYVYVEVQDFGSGMSAETVNKIFDPFFTTKDSGHGLGLAAVLGIVRTHHGAVRVDTVFGSGTTFRVHFPQVSCCVENRGY